MLKSGTYLKSLPALLLATAIAASSATPALARTRGSSQQAGNAAAASNQPEDVDVSKIKERYWTKGDESEVNVVQNRTYSKSGKLELGLFAGAVTTDPLISVHSLGASLAYHFSEFLALRAFGWKSFVTNSQALNTLLTTQNVLANTNEPRWFGGGELQASFLYGKLSFVGKSIIYYDLHALGGAGLTGTESGTYLTPFIGLGQQVYVTQWMSVNLDYRLMVYSENILDKVDVGNVGAFLQSRTNWTNAFTLGLNFLL